MLLDRCQLLALLLPTLVYAQSVAKSEIDGVYRGTLGQQQIVLEMGAVAPDRTGDPIEGRYFYREQGAAIPLEGTYLPDGSLRLRDHDNANPGAEWQLMVKGDQATGFFCACDVTQPQTTMVKRPIDLVRVSSGFDPYMLLGVDPNQPDKAYYDLLLDFPLQDGPEIQVGEDMAYVIQRDPRFRVSLPHLTRFPDAGVMAKVNQDLARELNERRLGVADCFYQGGQTGADWNEDERVTLLTRDLLSIVREGSSYCGGAHPHTIVEPLIYNLHSGNDFDLRDLFQIQSDDGPAKDGVVPNGREYKFLSDLYLKRYPKRTECKDVVSHKAYQAGEFNFLMYFSQKNLVLIPDLPYPAAAACAEAVDIPYGKLPNLRTDSPFKSLVQKNTQ